MNFIKLSAILRAIAVVVALVGVSACGSSSSSSGSSSSDSSSSSSTSSSGGSTSLLLKSVSGTDVAADGNWINCFNSNNIDQREEHVYSGTSLAINNFTGVSAGATCPGGTADASNSGTITLSAQTTVTVAGWLDGNGSPTAAPAKSSGGTLGGAPIVSMFTASGTFGGVTIPPQPLLAFVDDSVPAALKLWRDADPQDCSLYFAGATSCLSAVDPLTK